MTNKKFLLLGLAACALVGYIAYRTFSDDAHARQSAHFDDASESKIAAAGALLPPHAVLPSSANEKPVDISRLTYNKSAFKGAELPERLAEMASRRKGRVFDPELVAAALQSDEAWTVDPMVVNELKLTNAERRDGREFIRVDPLKFEALMPGDEISIPLRSVKADGPLRMVVDQVDNSLEGNVTWTGHLKDFETENQVSFTRGDTLIVGGVTTPDKNYVVQIDGDIGWVVDGFTIFKGRHDAIPPPSGGVEPAPIATGHTH